MTVLYVVLAVIGLGLVGGVVYFVKGALANRVSLGQRDAALKLEQEHTAKVDKADAEARTQRAKEFDEAKSSVTDAAGAADLLRRTLERARSSGTP